MIKEKEDMIRERIYNNNRILQFFDKKIPFIEKQVKSGIHHERGDMMRPSEIKNLNVVLTDLKKGRERVIKYLEDLEQKLI